MEPELAFAAPPPVPTPGREDSVYDDDYLAELAADGWDVDQWEPDPAPEPAEPDASSGAVPTAPDEQSATPVANPFAGHNPFTGMDPTAWDTPDPDWDIPSDTPAPGPLFDAPEEPSPAAPAPADPSGLRYAAPVGFEPAPVWTSDIDPDLVASLPGPTTVDIDGTPTPLLRIPDHTQPMVTAATLWLSVLAITRSDAQTLTSEDPKAGATSGVPKREKEHGHTVADYVGQRGIALITHYWDVLWPLRASSPARSLVQCTRCKQYWYVSGGGTAAPKKCAMTPGCEGPCEKAVKVDSAYELAYKAERKAQRNRGEDPTPDPDAEDQMPRRRRGRSRFPIQATDPDTDSSDSSTE